MRELNELTIDDLDAKACLMLMLEKLWVHVEDNDVQWLSSNQCLKTLAFIPDTLLPSITVSTLKYQHLTQPVDLFELQRRLVENAKKGGKKKKQLTDRYKKRPQKKWAVTSPSGVTEIITSIRDYAEKENLSRQGLTNAQRANVETYKGYKIRRLY